METAMAQATASGASEGSANKELGSPFYHYEWDRDYGKEFRPASSELSSMEHELREFGSRKKELEDRLAQLLAMDITA